MPSLLRRFVSDLTYTAPQHHSPTHGHPTPSRLSTNTATSSSNVSSSSFPPSELSASTTPSPPVAPVRAGSSIPASGDDAMFGSNSGGAHSTVNAHATQEGESSCERLEQRASALPTKSFQIRFVSQNCWGIPIATALEQRIEALCNLIKHSWDADVIACQEVFRHQDWHAIRQAAEDAGLSYTCRFPYGIGVGIWPQCGTTGLLLLSRYPIVESMYHRFSINGKPYKLLHCDYLGAKGIGLCRLDTPAGMVDAYVTHLHACYHDDNISSDEYFAHRTAQALELGQFVGATKKSPLSVVMGDFNSTPNSTQMRAVLGLGGLTDSYAEMHPSVSPDSRERHTFTPQGNSFRDDGEPPLALDYVLYSTSSRDHWKPISCRILNDYVERPSTSSTERHRHLDRPQDRHLPPVASSIDQHQGTTPVTIDPMLSPLNTSETAQLLRNGSSSRMLSPLHPDIPALHITPSSTSSSSSATDGDPAKTLISVSDHAGVVVDFSFFPSAAAAASSPPPSLAATGSDALGLGDLDDADVAKLEEIFAHGLDDALRRRRLHRRRALFAFFVGLPVTCAFAGWYFVVASLLLVALAVVEWSLAIFVVGDEISNFEGKFMDLRFIRMRHKHAEAACSNQRSNFISMHKHF